MLSIIPLAPPPPAPSAPTLLPLLLLPPTAARTAASAATPAVRSDERSQLPPAGACAPAAARTRASYVLSALATSDSSSRSRSGPLPPSARGHAASACARCVGVPHQHQRPTLRRRPLAARMPERCMHVAHANCKLRSLQLACPARHRHATPPPHTHTKHLLQAQAPTWQAASTPPACTKRRCAPLPGSAIATSATSAAAMWQASRLDRSVNL